MVLKVFTVYDSKVAAYKQPIFMRNAGEAIRAILDVMSNSEHPFSKYAEDYTLFELGEYDDDNASFNMELTPKSLAKLNELKAARSPIQPVQ